MKEKMLKIWSAGKWLALFAFSLLAGYIAYGQVTSKLEKKRREVKDVKDVKNKKIGELHTEINEENQRVGSNNVLILEKEKEVEDINKELVELDNKEKEMEEIVKNSSRRDNVKAIKHLLN